LGIGLLFVGGVVAFYVDFSLNFTVYPYLAYGSFVIISGIVCIVTGVGYHSSKDRYEAISEPYQK
jgi:uncharacterized membrane protein HdeD (DUF308 family)